MNLAASARDLATQRECLEMLGCYGKHKADRFADICAAPETVYRATSASAAIAADGRPPIARTAEA